MKYEKSVLTNGIRVVTVLMPSLESVTIDVWVAVGSRHEPEELNGISHFLEHVVMDGGKKYPTSNKLWTAIDSIGGEMNAGTTKVYTSYYTKLHKDHVKVGFDILSDVLLHTRFAAKDVKKERTVILDEIHMSNDNPRSVMKDNFDRLVFNGDSLSREIIGTKKIVSEMKKNDLVSYKEKYYVAENMVISSAGSVPHKEIVSLAESYFGSVSSDPSKKNTHPNTSTEVPKKRLSFKYKETEQTNFMLGFPALNDTQDPRRYALNVLRVILGSGVSSRLFLTVREKHALAYSVGNTIHTYPGAGYYGAYAGTDPKNASHALKLMIAEIEKMVSKKTARITKDELTKAKSYIKGHTALNLENSSEVSEYVGYDELIDEVIEMPDEYLEKIEKVTAEEVVQVANDIFDFDKMVLSVVGPNKNEGEFEKLLT